MSAGTPLPKRFHSLDVLRGLAALAVVLWHWNHFFAGAPFSPADTRLQPLYPLLRVPYTGGYAAVDFFFCLSGFVFFWLYGEALASRAFTVFAFARARFARLYPLHLLTLLVVLVLQKVLFRPRFGFEFIYQNHLSDFFFQLGLAMTWFGGHVNWLSFNGPAWSISMEVLLYALFLLACRIGLAGWKGTLGCLVGLFVLHRCFPVSGTVPAATSFFMGGMAFHVLRAVAARGLDRRVLWGTAAAVAVFAAVYAAIGSKHGATLNHLVFAIVIFCAAAVETRRGRLGKRFALLGDLSYGIYLWHFPLQLGFAAAALLWATDPATFFESPLVLALFIAILLGIAWISHRFFERPLQDWLRGR